MKRFFGFIAGIDRCLFIIAGLVLAFMIVLTFCDVILRNFGHPITGSMEFIQYGGCIVFAFSVPYGTMLGSQVIVDIITGRLGRRNKRILGAITRCLGISIFLFIAYYFFIYGIGVKGTGECTAYFRIPYYPFAYALSFAFLIQSMTILCDLMKTLKGEEDE